MGTAARIEETPRVALGLNLMGWGVIVLGVVSIFLDAVCFFASLFTALLPPLAVRVDSLGNISNGTLPIIATLLLLKTGRGLLTRQPWARRGAMLLLPLAVLLIWPWPYLFAGWWWPLSRHYLLCLLAYLATIALGSSLLCFLLSRPAVKAAFALKRPLNWAWLERQRHPRRAKRA